MGRIASRFPTRRGKRLQMSVEGIAFLLREEGLAVKAYRDSQGVWTIGVGHTAAAGAPRPRAGMHLTQEAAVRLMATDLRRYERRVRRALGGREVPQHVFDALVSFDYNTGGIHKASFLKPLMQGRLREAETRFMWWRRPDDVIPRRRRELALWRDADYDDLSKATLWTADDSGRPVASGVFDPLELAQRALRERAPVADALDHGMVKAVQRKLKELGYHEVGAVDGIAGPRTRAALNAWLLDHGYQPVRDVYALDDDVRADLLTANRGRPESPQRETATAADLRRAGSTDIRRADWGLAGGTGLAMLGAVGETARRVGDSLDSIASPIRLFIADNATAILIAAGIAGAALAWTWRRNRVRRHREGSYVSR